MSLNDFDIINNLAFEEKYAILKVKRKKDGLIYLIKNVNFILLDKEGKQNAINEIKILSSLHHPNIIEFKEAFYDEPSNSLNLVLEFPNNNLRHKIDYAFKNEMRMEESTIFEVLTQLLIGLNYLHKKGIIHRNLESKNIFLTKNRLIKISNFNSCLIMNKSNINQPHINKSLYTAPEIWNKKKFNYKCDIWSLGCIIYEMASLSLPFSLDNSNKMLDFKDGKIKPIPEFYSSKLKSVINDMLALDPSKRPSTDILLNNPTIIETIKKLSSFYGINKNNIIIKDNSQIFNNIIKINENLNKDLSKKNKNERRNKTSLNSRNPSKYDFFSKSDNLINIENINENKDDDDEKVKNNLKRKIKKTINNATYRTLRERKIINQSVGRKDNKIQKNGNTFYKQNKIRNNVIDVNNDIILNNNNKRNNFLNYYASQSESNNEYMNNKEENLAFGSFSMINANINSYLPDNLKNNILMKPQNLLLKGQNKKRRMDYNAFKTNQIKYIPTISEYDNNIIENINIPFYNSIFKAQTYTENEINNTINQFKNTPKINSTNNLLNQKFKKQNKNKINRDNIKNQNNNRNLSYINTLNSSQKKLINKNDLNYDKDKVNNNTDIQDIKLIYNSNNSHIIYNKINSNKKNFQNNSNIIKNNENIQKISNKKKKIYKINKINKENSNYKNNYCKNVSVNENSQKNLGNYNINNINNLSDVLNFNRQNTSKQNNNKKPINFNNNKINNKNIEKCKKELKILPGINKNSNSYIMKVENLKVLNNANKVPNASPNSVKMNMNLNQSDNKNSISNQKLKINYIPKNTYGNGLYEHNKNIYLYTSVNNANGNIIYK